MVSNEHSQFQILTCNYGLKYLRKIKDCRLYYKGFTTLSCSSEKPSFDFKFLRQRKKNASVWFLRFSLSFGSAAAGVLRQRKVDTISKLRNPLLCSKFL